MSQFETEVSAILAADAGKQLGDATVKELYQAVSKAALARVRPAWEEGKHGRRACYFSAEFLIGRMVYANLFNMGLSGELEALLRGAGLSPAVFEEIEDAALGNGGLGRLAACFLDSAATQNIPLDGFGIRYRYGLFHQEIVDGYQQETKDDWLEFGDPWSVRREEDKVLVHFGNQSVWAVPYDMPVIGYGDSTVNNLRLWQAEAVNSFDFTLFNDQLYRDAVAARDDAEAITCVLYPNDDTDAGRRLRLKQQYFFCAASLTSILHTYKSHHGSDLSHLSDDFAIQLNDTHPTVAIPELLRLLMEEEKLSFEQAFPIIRRVFSYTNHTIMAEALETWDKQLFASVLPDVWPYVVLLQNSLVRELAERKTDAEPYRIISGGRIHMARMAIYATHATNGVARLHTEILKSSALKQWYDLYPDRFFNETNGITQRRWLGLSNPELAAFITNHIGDGWLTELTELKRLEPFLSDEAVIRRFMEIKKEKKRQLASFVLAQEGETIDPDFLFDIQVKRLHEYKRQLLNAFSIMDIYFGLKDGRIRKFYPTVFLFGAKAAPGYRRAKGIIKYIGEIARLINNDPDVKGLMKVVFVHNYNVSYAEKLIPAADVSEQISTAGTEASGTGNMKFMLNGAVTLGTYDGANVEIVEQAGQENNYIFGARVEELAKMDGSYDPKRIYDNIARVRAAVDTLIDGTFSDGGTGMFQELYDSLLTGAAWHKPDHYYLLLDFIPYCDKRLEVNQDYKNNIEDFSRKCLINTANAGKFSSDRTIQGYAKDIWKL